MLPKTGSKGTELTSMPGKEVILTGVKEIDGEKVIKDKDYLISVPVIHQSNHEKKLKAAYSKSGKEGVFQYIISTVKASGKITDQEFENSLRHEIFSSGNFEENHERQQFRRRSTSVETAVSICESQKDSLTSQQIEEEMIKVLDMIATIKEEHEISDDDKKSLDKYTNKAYRLMNV
jgi:hypothetical protein